MKSQTEKAVHVYLQYRSGSQTAASVCTELYSMMSKVHRPRTQQARVSDRLMAEYLRELQIRGDLGWFENERYVKEFNAAYDGNGGVSLTYYGEVPRAELNYLVKGIKNKDVSPDFVAYFSGKYPGASGSPDPAHAFALLVSMNMRQIRNALSAELKKCGVGVWYDAA